jgi:hypothetical protein
MSFTKNLMRKMKDKTFDPIEVKVREATSSEPWMPSNALLGEVAAATHDYELYQVCSTISSSPHLPCAPPQPFSRRGRRRIENVARAGVVV